MKLIKGGKIFTPEAIGVKDILIVGSMIARIDQNIVIPDGIKLGVDIYDAKDRIVCPGLIDSHIHLIGGGGAAGFTSRTKEISIEKIVDSGVTTVVGCLGLDHVSRNLKTLLIKAKALELGGISSYILGGSFVLPSVTVTGSIEEDLIFIDKVIGLKLAVGEAASTHPGKRELKNILAEIRRGASLSGKAGILQVHLGPGGGDWIKIFMEILSEMKIPFNKVIFIHSNRSEEIFNACIEYTKQGGAMDLSASFKIIERPGSLRASEVLNGLIEQKVPLDRITLSSDGNSSSVLPDGKFVYIETKHVFSEVRKLVIEHKVDLSTAIKPVTSNVAKLYQIDGKKGALEVGKDADLLIMNGNLDIRDVMAMGNWVVREGQTIIRDPV
jgi:beta-aspartyl-dipeptidase (metallo-type)